jgi:hypothetical protein
MLLNGILDCGSRLTDIHIGGDCIHGFADLLIESVPASLGKLQSLSKSSLKQMVLKDDSLSQLLTCCSETLQELELERIGLSNRTWKPVFSLIAERFNLMSLWLGRLNQLGCGVSFIAMDEERPTSYTVNERATFVGDWEEISRLDKGMLATYVVVHKPGPDELPEDFDEFRIR